MSRKSRLNRARRQTPRNEPRPYGNWRMAAAEPAELVVNSEAVSENTEPVEQSGFNLFVEIADKALGSNFPIHFEPIERAPNSGSLYFDANTTNELNESAFAGTTVPHNRIQFCYSPKNDQALLVFGGMGERALVVMMEELGTYHQPTSVMIDVKNAQENLPCILQTWQRIMIQHGQTRFRRVADAFQSCAIQNRLMTTTLPDGNSPDLGTIEIASRSPLLVACTPGNGHVQLSSADLGTLKENLLKTFGEEAFNGDNLTIARTDAEIRKFSKILFSEATPA